MSGDDVYGRGCVACKPAARPRYGIEDPNTGLFLAGTLTIGYRQRAPAWRRGDDPAGFRWWYNLDQARREAEALTRFGERLDRDGNYVLGPYASARVVGL